MLFYLLVGALASIFYYIGNNEYYRKVWLLAILSVLMSLGTTIVLPLALLSPVIGNVVLYVIILIYNMLSNRPPRSGSGF